MGANNKGRPRINAVVQAHLIRLLVDDYHTAQDLAEETGLSPGTVRSYLRALKARKLVHIVSKEPDRGGQRSIAVWSFDPDKKDMSKPATPADRARTYRARKSANIIAQTWHGAASTATIG